MRVITGLLSAMNMCLGTVAVLPCLMAGLMSMDSPQAQHSVAAHVGCYLMLSFPLVCFVCSFVAAGILLDRRPKAAFCVSLFPIAEAFAFFGWLYFLQWTRGV